MGWYPLLVQKKYEGSDEIFKHATSFLIRVFFRLYDSVILKILDNFYLKWEKLEQNHFLNLLKFDGYIKY